MEITNLDRELNPITSNLVSLKEDNALKPTVRINFRYSY